MITLQTLGSIVLIGIGATLVLDGWLLLLKRIGIPTLDFALLGRWVGHLARGRLAHVAIAKSPALRGERALGWLAHYAIGIAFAAGLVLIRGEAWLQQPTAGAALVFGSCTVLAPLLVLQPAMGAGVASSRTATPVKNVLRSVANHLVFGGGLYLAALFAARWLS